MIAKYYKLGYRNNFKFLVRSDVGIDIVNRFYSPSRWWAKLAMQFRLFRLNVVNASELLRYNLTGEEAILLKGNDAENQKHIVYMDRLNIVRKWSVNSGGIGKIKNEVNALLGLENSEFPFGYPHLLDCSVMDDYAYLDIEYIVSDCAVECSDNFVRDYFNLFIKKNSSKFSLVHGDLTPWNVIRTSCRTFIIDWEESRVSNKYYDILYYYFAWYHLGKNNSKELSIELAVKRIESLGLPLNDSNMVEAIKELRLVKNIC